MNVAKLYGTLAFIGELDQQLQLQRHLEAIVSSLSNLTESPADTAQQAALAKSWAAFAAAADKLIDSITPAQRALIAETGGARFFDREMAEQIGTAITTNAMTPSVARDEVRRFSSARSQFIANANATLEGLKSMKLNLDSLETVPAEMSFLIPRGIFANHLKGFGKEIAFLDSLIRHCAELVGEPPEADLRTLSTSDPAVGIFAALPVILAISQIVNEFLEAWKKVEQIRQIRETVRQVGVSGTALAEFTQKIQETINGVVETAIGRLRERSAVEEGRKNELTNALSRDLHKLFIRIEKGMTIEIRVDADTEADETEDDSVPAIEQLRTLSRSLQFPVLTGEPLLLAPPDGDDVENDAPPPIVDNSVPRRPRKRPSQA